jgi:hypothetical protein
VACGKRPLVVDCVCIGELAKAGLTMREIGEEMGISAASVCRILKAHHSSEQAPHL